MGDLRANPARDLAFQESIEEGHLWECESFYSGWDAAIAYALEAVRQEREAIMELALQKSATFPADSDYTRGYALAKQAFAAAIRARSEQGGEG